MGLMRELTEIFASDEVFGIERYTALVLRSFMFLSLGYWVTRLFSGPKSYIAVETKIIYRSRSVRCAVARRIGSANQH